MFGSAARGTRYPAPGKYAGLSALPGVREEGQGGPEWPHRKGASDVSSEVKSHSSAA